MDRQSSAHLSKRAVIACAVTLIGALAVPTILTVTCVTENPPHENGWAASRQAHSVRPRSGTDAGTLSDVSRTPQTPLALRCIDVISGKPVIDARIAILASRISQPASSFAPEDLTRTAAGSVWLRDLMTLAHADAEGVIPLPTMSSIVGVYVVAPSYVLAALSDEHMRQGVIALTPTTPLEITCVDDVGMPVSGCQVHLSNATLPMLRLLPAEVSIGNPNHRRPIWCATTDKNGKAIVDHVPPGSYRWNIVHETHCPTILFGSGSEQIVVPSMPRVVTMRELHGVVAYTTEDVAIATHRFSYDRGKVWTDVGHAARLEYASRRLRSRFPGCAALVVFPRLPETAIPVSASATTADGKRWHGKFAFQPVSKIASGAYMEEQESEGLRKIMVAVEADNQRLAGLMLVLATPSGEYSHIVKEGVQDAVPPGEYRVYLNRPIPGLTHLFMGRAVVVESGDGVQTVELRVPGSYGRLRVEIGGSTDGLDYQFYLGVRGPSGGSMRLVLPGEAIPDMWVPEGQYVVRINSPFYRDIPTHVVVRAGGEPTIAKLVPEER